MEAGMYCRKEIPAGNQKVHTKDTPVKEKEYRKALLAYI